MEHAHRQQVPQNPAAEERPSPDPTSMTEAELEKLASALAMELAKRRSK
ncbi:hypothetical protein ACFLSJ_04925 [Verrucomicrobiota bacterium]